VAANTFAAPAENATVNITNSIIRDAHLEAATPASGTGQSSVAISYSDYDPGADESNGPHTSIARAHVTNVGDAKFADPVLGDFHLLPSSPLIDAGDPVTPLGSDLDGNPLVRDGNGDGTPRRDVGAFEYQAGAALGDPPPGGGPAADTQAPRIGSFRATPTRFALARAVTPVAAGVPRGTRFRYTLSERARVTVKLQRALPGTRYVSAGTLRRHGAKGANIIRFSGRIGKRALRPGTYRAVISATDTAANRSAPHRARLRIVGR